MRSTLLNTILVQVSHTTHSINSPGYGRTWLLPLVIGLCVSFMTISAYAEFLVVEDFENLTHGTINGQNEWVATSGSGEVVADSVDNSNQALKVSTESGRLYKSVKVAQGTRRMLFLRLRYQEHGRFSFGLSHLAAPYEFSDFGPELGMAADTAVNPENNFRVANGLLSTGIYDELTTLAPGTWYNTWILIDTTSNTYQIWMNSIPGGDARSSDQLKNSVGASLFGFRTGSTKDLLNFYIKTGGGTSPIDGRFYLDDIFLEDTGNINLNNPLTKDKSGQPSLSWLLLLLLKT